MLLETALAQAAQEARVHGRRGSWRPSSRTRLRRCASSPGRPAARWRGDADRPGSVQLTTSLRRKRRKASAIRMAAYVIDTDAPLTMPPQSTSGVSASVQALFQ